MIIDVTTLMPLRRRCPVRRRGTTRRAREIVRRRMTQCRYACASGVRRAGGQPIGCMRWMIFASERMRGSSKPPPSSLMSTCSFESMPSLFPPRICQTRVDTDIGDPRLAAVEVTGKDRGPIQHSIDVTKLSDEELLIFERIIAKAQVPSVEIDHDETEGTCCQEQWVC